VGWAWARYLLAGRRQGLPALVDFIFQNYFFTAKQVRSELTALGEILAELRPQRALEIGTAKGGTLLFLTRLASPTATLASIDLEAESGGYSETRQWFYERFARRKQHLHLIRGDSHQFWMRRRLGEVFDGRPLDYLFIDGDHRYEGVKKDFEMYARLVRKGGVIAFHDIVEGKPELVGEVPQFWREIKSGYRHQEFIEDPQQGGYGIGVLYID
jgi:predicted O-methyltransferase YrrM